MNWKAFCSMFASSKAPGYHIISMRVIKHSFHLISAPLANIINLSIYKKAGSSSWGPGNNVISCLMKPKTEFLLCQGERFFTGLPVWQSQSESGWDLFVSFILFILFLFFAVSVKVLPVTPMASGVFVYRAFCAYFLRIERVVEMSRFLWWTQ